MESKRSETAGAEDLVPGMNVIAKDGDGNYYLGCGPTDVRYERATVEEMRRDSGQWSMLCAWAESVTDRLIEQNGLEPVYFGNSDVDIYLARAVWMDGAKPTLSTPEFGPVEANTVDGEPYVESLLQSGFQWVDAKETPDGEYVTLRFPEEDARLDFFFAPGGYVRFASGEQATLYQAFWYGDVSPAEAMQGWYYALCELAGLKPFDMSLEHFYGPWYEKIAGRGEINIEWCVAPGKVNIAARWPESAAVENTWTITARLEDGRLVYENGRWEKNEYDEDGNKWQLDGSWEESGYFELSGGELSWHDDNADHGGDSTFIK